MQPALAGRATDVSVIEIGRIDATPVIAKLDQRLPPAIFDSGYLGQAKVMVGAAETFHRILAASRLEVLDTERRSVTTQTEYLDTIFGRRARLNAPGPSVGVARGEKQRLSGQSSHSGQ